MIPTRSRASLVVALLAVAGPDSAFGQEYSPEPTIRWVATESVPDNSIVGIVVDSESGLPIKSAQVVIRGTYFGALADSAGRFSIDASRLGEASVVLVAEYIGYHAVEQPVQFVSGAGLAVHATLKKVKQVVCGVMVCGYDGGKGSCPGGVRVAITGALDWLPDDTPVSLVVRSGPHADTTVVRAEGRVYLAAGESLGTDGPFEVVVNAPGYQDWYASGIWLYSRDCFATKASKPVHAYLLPAGIN